MSSSKNQTLKILFQIPKIIKNIKTENAFVASYIKSNKIDLIISDNRYGFRNKEVKSVIITHQTYIKTPLKIKFFEQLLNIVNTKQINKFSECWVPDIENENNLSGDLSHKNKKIKNIKYIGILSRFEKLKTKLKTNKVLAVISGPEPQRTIFEDILINKLSKEKYNTIIIRGTNKDVKIDTNNLSFINIADSKKLQQLISQSEIIISRSGYTSILDYIKLGIKAILVPTPGQTEQEYLAKYLSEKYNFKYVRQIDLTKFKIEE